jgi:hypothetical protein
MTKMGVGGNSNFAMATKGSANPASFSGGCSDKYLEAFAFTSCHQSVNKGSINAIIVGD